MHTVVTSENPLKLTCVKSRGVYQNYEHLFKMKGRVWVRTRDPFRAYGCDRWEVLHAHLCKNKVRVLVLCTAFPNRGVLIRSVTGTKRHGCERMHPPQRLWFAGANHNAPAEPRKSEPCSFWAAAGNVHGAGMQAAVGRGVQSLARRPRERSCAPFRERERCIIEQEELGGTTENTHPPLG